MTIIARICWHERNCSNFFTKLGSLHSFEAFKKFQIDHNDIETATFFALNDWKEQKVNNNCEQLLAELCDALPAVGYDSHLLCQVGKNCNHR
jgi:hypothetical protein